MSKFQLVCCCIICKTEVTAQSLKAHNNKHINNNRPCKYCGTMFTARPADPKQFCSSSCSASYNNPLKSTKPGPKPGFRKGVTQVCKVSWCVVCNAMIQHKHTKTCSDECRRIRWSTKAKLHSKTTRHNRNPNKQSYMEESFTEWVQQQGFTIDQDVIPEFKVHNPLLNRTYFIDFYFPHIKLAVELDGSQHIHTSEADAVRDEYLLTECGITTFRITHKEYKAKTKIEHLTQLLTRCF